LPEIRIQDSTFARLQRHARPFVDTPDSVINLALDALEAAGAPAGGGEGDGHGPQIERRIDPRNLPSLTHTKVLSAMIDGKAIAKANWNLLLDEMLRRATKQLQSLHKVRDLVPVNMIQGRKEDEGYSYLTDINVSVQGQDANAACRAIVAAAHGLGIALDLVFMWRHKESAAHPGERARIVIAAKEGI
jgi:hypothetical protein